MKQNQVYSSTTETSLQSEAAIALQTTSTLAWERPIQSDLITHETWHQVQREALPRQASATVAWQQEACIHLV